MDRSNEIIQYVDAELVNKESVDTKDVMNALNVAKQEIFIALYTKGGYTITGALTNYGTISKLK